MPEPISPNVERLTRQYVDGKRFSSSDEVLIFAMSLFGAFEQRYHDELGKSLQDAFHTISGHKGIVLDGAKEVESFFADMMESSPHDSRFRDGR
jgi:hypothetical protein